MPDKCTVCSVDLAEGDNWTVGLARKRNRLCRACNSEKGKRWYAANKAKAAEAQRARHRRDPGKPAASRRSWYERNKARHAELTKANYRRYKLDPILRARMMAHWCKKRAQSIGVSYDLDAAWIGERLTTGRCEVTGIRFDFAGDSVGSKGRFAAFAPSMDRIDCTKGYERDNVRLVVWIYNMAKSEFTDDAVLTMARALVANA